MGYLIPKPKSLNMKRNDDFDENLKKLEKEIEKRRKQQCYEQMGYTNVCGSVYDANTFENVCQAPKYVDAYDAQGLSCAKVSAAYIPNHERHDDWSNATIDYLRSENQRLTQNIQKVIGQNAQLVDEINRLRRENSELKGKKAKKENFDKKIHDGFSGLGAEFKKIYDKFVTWLNT